ncbi:MAG: M23 family metallopeptidase, partial [Paracoccaceae bacterium]
VGDLIERGDRIGDMGSTGRSTGTHLHYEVRIDGKPVNPAKYIEAARNVL